LSKWRSTVYGLKNAAQKEQGFSALIVSLLLNKFMFRRQNNSEVSIQRAFVWFPGPTETAYVKQM
jgi:hypothetical protein